MPNQKQMENGLSPPLIENGYCNNSLEKIQKQKRKRTPREWFKKYFWEGQKLHGISEEEKQIPLPSNATFEQKMLIKYKNFIALLIPFSVAQFIWWSSAIKYNFFSLYSTHWQMPLTMVVGSIIAGMTSEGGGAVAFPIGMTMAFFVIIFMRIQIEWRAIIFGTIGAIPGALIGFTLIEPLFNPQTEKMLFVSIWSSFAISLWILNCEKKRKTFNTIENFCFWKCIILILTGFIGGILNFTVPNFSRFYVSLHLLLEAALIFVHSQL
ncbi:unnamed protein product [Meloidogyne enterolobii]|uniref:Uncharacterized protein n=1 Tax=Meloidogyne enterolobii TaxID=390850 RepID=A0ACB0ZV11_MELEN